MLRNHSVRVLFCTMLVVASFGCRPEDPITRVVIDAEQSGITFNEEEDLAQAEPARPARMVVAIHQAEDSTWTFKVSGPLELVNQAEAKCLEFFRQVEFDNAVPKMGKLPEGWSPVAVKPGPFAPFARLQIADGLTMSVSKLPAGFDMLSNVNRWRGQVSLSKTDSIDLQPLSGDSKTKFEVFDVVGSLSGGGGMMTPPFAGGRGEARVQPPSESEITYLAPPGWEVGRSSQIVAARLSKAEEDLLVQITVVKLPATLNSWQQVTRNWAGEVGMQSLTDEEMKERTSSVTVGTQKGQGVRLIDDDEKIDQAIVGFRTVKGSDAWFVKLKGDKKLVIENEKDFTAFAKTIRFQERK